MDRVTADLALATYLRPLISDRHVLWIGDAGAKVSALLGEVCLFRAFPTLTSRGTSEDRVVTPVEVVVVPDLPIEEKSWSEALRVWLDTAQMAVVGVWLTDTCSTAPSELEEFLLERYAHGRRLGQADFRGASIMEVGASASGELDELTVDGSLVDLAPEAYRLLWVAADRALPYAESIVQVPLARADQDGRQSELSAADIDRLERALQEQGRKLRELAAEIARRGVLVRDLIERGTFHKVLPAETVDARLAGTVRGFRSRIAELEELRAVAEGRCMLAEEQLRDLRERERELERKVGDLADRAAIHAMKAEALSSRSHGDEQADCMRAELLGMRLRLDDAETALMAKASPAFPAASSSVRGANERIENLELALTEQTNRAEEFERKCSRLSEESTRLRRALDDLSEQAALSSGSSDMAIRHALSDIRAVLSDLSSQLQRSPAHVTDPD